MARVSRRYHAVGFGQDFALFLSWIVIPLWATYDAEASPLLLGLLAVPGGTAYFLGALWTGRLSDRVSRTMLVRLGLLLFALYCFLAWWATSPWVVLALTPICGFGNSLIWPCLQAKMGDESSAADLETNLGGFSLCWSAGKTLGFLLGGLIFDVYRKDAMLLCGIVGLAIIPLVPLSSPHHHGPPLRLVEDHGPSPSVRRAHLHASWWVNFGAYGLGAVVNYLFAKILKDAGRPETDLGWVLGALFSAQTLGFWIFGTWAGWRYRRGPLLAWQIAGAGALLFLAFSGTLWVEILASLVTGLALGHAYSASVYYTIHSDEDRGARAGIHESLMGVANFAAPALGGIAVALSGWNAAPYLIAVFMVAGALVMASRTITREQRASHP
jgi:predicted MFS family arabinose efflux permease